MIPPSSGSSFARSLLAWPWRLTYYVYLKARTVCLTTKPSHLVTQKPSATLLAEHQTHYIYSEANSCGIHPVLIYIRNVRIYSTIKIKFTFAMVVVFEYGLFKRVSNLWPASTKRALNALIPCRHPMSSGDLERLNSADTFLWRENACTNFILVP
jgi:hypothetical protein